MSDFARYARCERCGHLPDSHTTTECTHRTAGGPLLGYPQAKCDCPGWKRDPEWPPPVVTGGVR